MRELLTLVTCRPPISNILTVELYNATHPTISEIIPLLTHPAFSQAKHSHAACYSHDPPVNSPRSHSLLCHHSPTISPCCITTPLEFPWCIPSFEFRQWHRPDKLLDRIHSRCIWSCRCLRSHDLESRVSMRESSRLCRCGMKPIDNNLLTVSSRLPTTILSRLAFDRDGLSGTDGFAEFAGCDDGGEGGKVSDETESDGCPFQSSPLSIAVADNGIGYTKGETSSESNVVALDAVSNRSRQEDVACREKKVYSRVCKITYPFYVDDYLQTTQSRPVLAIRSRFPAIPSSPHPASEILTLTNTPLLSIRIPPQRMFSSESR